MDSQVTALAERLFKDSAQPPLPQDSFDLALFVHQSVGSALAEEAQRDLFHLIQKRLGGEEGVEEKNFETWKDPFKRNSSVSAAASQPAVSAECPSPPTSPVSEEKKNFELAQKAPAYVLYGDSGRVPFRSCPVMSNGACPRVHFDVSAKMHHTLGSNPFALYEAAEHVLESPDSVNSDWNIAVEKLLKASFGFHFAGLSRMAANCLVRLADVDVAMERYDEAAHALDLAVRYHSLEDSGQCSDSKQASLACLQGALLLFDHSGRELSVARLMRQASELAVEASNPGFAIDLLHLAADVMIKYNENEAARACLKRAASISVLDFSDYAEAVDTLERLATVTPLAERKFVYFQALICRMVCVPAANGIECVEAQEDVKVTMEDYQIRCPQLNNSREYNLLNVIVKVLRNLDDQALEKAICVYLDSNQDKIQQDEWTELAIRRIHSNILERKEKLYKEYSL